MEDRKLTRNLHRVTVWRYCCCCWRRSVGGGRMLRRDCWQLFSHRKICSHKLWKGLSCYSTLYACCYWLFLGCFLPQGFYQFLGLTYLPACPFGKCVDHDDDLKCLISRPQKKKREENGNSNAFEENDVAASGDGGGGVGHGDGSNVDSGGVWRCC